MQVNRSSTGNGVYVTNLTLLEWDTRHFGFPVARAEWSGDLRELEVLLDCAGASEVTLLYLFGSAGARLPEKVVGNCAGLYVCQRVEFEKPVVSPAPLNLPDGLEIGELTWENCDRERVRQLGVVAGDYSRFLRDPLIPQGKGEELFRIWAEESVSRRLADVVFAILEKPHKIVGLITLRGDRDAARIGLLAVCGEYRRRGLGKQLLAAGERWAYFAGYRLVRVATQAENEEACGFYLRQGFAEVERKNVYHIWLKRP